MRRTKSKMSRVCFLRSWGSRHQFQIIADGNTPPEQPPWTLESAELHSARHLWLLIIVWQMVQCQQRKDQWSQQRGTWEKEHPDDTATPQNPSSIYAQKNQKVSVEKSSIEKGGACLCRFDSIAGGNVQEFVADKVFNGIRQEGVPEQTDATQEGMQPPLPVSQCWRYDFTVDGRAFDQGKWQNDRIGSAVGKVGTGETSGSNLQSDDYGARHFGGLLQF